MLRLFFVRFINKKTAAAHKAPRLSAKFLCFPVFLHSDVLPVLNRFRRSFHGQRRLLVQQLHKGLLLRAQGPPVRIDQNILHALALGRTLPEHQMILLQRHGDFSFFQGN